MPESAPAPEDSPERYEGLPESWSDSARETYVQVEEDLSDPDAAALAALFEACALIARADALAEVVEERGYFVQGYRSEVLNPAIAEERHARTAALDALRRMAAAPGQSPASRSGAALAAKRWQGRTPGRRQA